MTSPKRTSFYARVLTDPNLYKVNISDKEAFHYGAEVIIKTEFGIDLAVVTSFKSTSETKDKSCYRSGQLIRYATQEDKDNKKVMQKKSLELKPQIAQLIEHFQLKMNLTHVLVPLSDDSICIYYTAPKRVDFRYLLAELKNTFKTKIFLKHITSKQREKSFHQDSRILY